LICNELVLHVAAFPRPNELLFELRLYSSVRDKPSTLAGSKVRQCDEQTANERSSHEGDASIRFVQL
jgi:hypothetical protein